MNTNEASFSVRFRVGIFTLLGLLLIGAVTIYVNHKPYWWRPCQPVRISVEDATGLKTKSPIRSLGLEIGYLESVELNETSVTLGICITAPVEVLQDTKAYIRGEGFLGDKFVELKPIKYLGGMKQKAGNFPGPQKLSQAVIYFDRVVGWLESNAQAAPTVEPVQSATPSTAITTTAKGREIPVGAQQEDVQHLVKRVDSLVNEMTNLTSDLRQSINPEDLKNTMQKLNSTLENASKTLSPQGGLTQTAQRTLAKLEDAIEQLRDQMTRMNQGQGSVGMLLNDPSYALEIKKAVQNANRLLSKVNDVRFVVDIGAEEISGYNGSRGFFKLQIYPKHDHYYLLGISVDPRGRRTEINDQITSGNTVTQTQDIRNEKQGILITAMFGQLLFDRVDLSLGALYGDGSVSFALRLGPKGEEERIILRNDVYSRTGDNGIGDRINVIVKPFMSLYVRAGVETLQTINGTTAYSYGAGVQFDDEDIKLLFALR